MKSLKLKSLKTLTRLGVANNGSTIVGVLAALVFIGIVTGVMVKNTGAQAAASTGYGTAMTMHSTVNSGMIATEGFFSNPNSKDTATKIIDSLVNRNIPVVGSDAGRYIFGKTGEKKKIPNSTEQFFSSKAPKKAVNNISSKGSVNVGFQIAVGKKAGGRQAQTGYVFYELGNLKQPSAAAPPFNGAKNAVYTTGKMDNADAGMTVENGGGTFINDAIFQNAAAIFKKTAYFGGETRFAKDSAIFKDSAFFVNASKTAEFKVKTVFDSLVYFAGPVKFAAPVTFKDKVYFMNGVTFDGSAPSTFDGLAYFKGVPKFQSDVTFKNKAYFDNNPATGIVEFEKAVTFESSGDGQWTIFKRNVKFTGKGTFYVETYFGGTVELGDKLDFYHRVGFNDNIKLNNNTIKSNKGVAGGKFDVAINGKIIDGNLNQNQIVGIGSTEKDKDGKYQDVYYSTTFSTVAWALNALKEFKDKKPDGGTTVVSRFNFNTADNTLITTFPNIPSTPDPDKRKDPQLSVQPIYNASTRNGGSVVIYDAKDAIADPNATTQFSIIQLDKTYKDALKNPSTLYMGKYMVVEVTSDITFSGNPGTYDANIIYIITGTGSINGGAGSFYSSTTNSTANTLIYVGAGNARLMQFGTKDDFRGFVYIDEANTSTQNSIHFKAINKPETPKGKVIGAIHNFSSNKLEWNTGTSEYSTPVKFDPTVLQDFGDLYAHKAGTVVTNPGTGTGTGKVEVQSGQNISVRSLGVYFY